MLMVVERMIVVETIVVEMIVVEMIEIEKRMELYSGQRRMIQL